MLGWAPGPAGRAQVGTLGATGFGVTLTGSGSTNVKGSWASLGTVNSSWGSVCVSTAVVGQYDVTFDIGVSSDGGTTVWVLAPDLRVPNAPSLYYGMGRTWQLPLRVPNGTVLYGRCASSTASGQVAVAVAGGPGLWGHPGFGRMVSLYTVSSSRGTAIDPGGSANTKGSWTSISTGVSQRVVAWMATIGGNTDISRVAMSWLWDLEAAASGSEGTVPRWANMPMSAYAAGADLRPGVVGPVPCDVPASTAWRARAQCSATTAGDRTFDLSLHGFVP